MPIPVGYHSYAIYGIETTYGTGVEGDKAFMPIKRIDVSERDELYKRRAIGNGRNIVEAINGIYSATINYEMDLTQKEGYLWELILGGDVVQDDEDATKNKVEESEEIKSFSSILVYKGTDGSIPYRAVGSVVNTARLSLGTRDAPITLSLDTISKKIMKMASTPDAIDPQGDVLTSYETTITWGGSEPTAVRELTLTIDNKPIQRRKIGSRFLIGVKGGAREYSIDMKLEFDELDLYNDFWGNTEAPTTHSTKQPKDLEIIMNKNGSEAMKLILEDVWLEQFSKPIPLEDDVIIANVRGIAKSLKKVRYTP